MPSTASKTSKFLHFECGCCSTVKEVPHDPGRTGGGRRPKNWIVFKALGRNGAQEIQLCPDCILNHRFTMHDLTILPIMSRGEEPEIIGCVWEDEEKETVIDPIWSEDFVNVAG